MRKVLAIIRRLLVSKSWINQYDYYKDEETGGR